MGEGATEGQGRGRAGGRGGVRGSGVRRGIRREDGGRAGNRGGNRGGVRGREASSQGQGAGDKGRWQGVRAVPPEELAKAAGSAVSQLHPGRPRSVLFRRPRCPRLPPEAAAELPGRPQGRVPKAEPAAIPPGRSPGPPGPPGRRVLRAWVTGPPWLHRQALPSGPIHGRRRGISPRWSWGNCPLAGVCRATPGRCSHHRAGSGGRHESGALQLGPGSWEWQGSLLSEARATVPV